MRILAVTGVNVNFEATMRSTDILIFVHAYLNKRTLTSRIKTNSLNIWDVY
jgi:hypothetical protein